MSAQDEWPLPGKTASPWTPLKTKLHWKEVAAGEPHRTLHPSSDHLGPEQPDWTDRPKATRWTVPPADPEPDAAPDSLSSQVRARQLQLVRGHDARRVLSLSLSVAAVAHHRWAVTQDTWPYRETSSKWLDVPPPLHWREVAAGEPDTSLRPPSLVRAISV